MFLAADNINVMNPVVAEAMESLEGGPIRELAKKCEQAGADLIDINPGRLSTRKKDRIVFLIEAVQDAASARLILDSPDPALLEIGLAACREKPILSALTMEKEKLERVLPLAAKEDTDLIVLLIDEGSMPPASCDEKLALALELYQKAVAVGIAPEKLIFDPVLPNMSWPDALKLAGESTRAIQITSGGGLFGEPARTIAGLSNLLSGERRAMHPDGIDESVACALAGAGIEIMLANVLNLRFMKTWRVLERIFP